MATHQTNERWHEICALAAEEQDAEQVQKLTREINRLLEDKERRLKRELPIPADARDQATDPNLGRLHEALPHSVLVAQGWLVHTPGRPSVCRR